MSELSELLKWHGMSQARLARHLHVDKMTVHRWVNGKTPTPRSVLLYLELWKQIKSTVEGAKEFVKRFPG